MGQLSAWQVSCNAWVEDFNNINFAKLTMIKSPKEISKKMDICTFDYSIRVMNNYTGSTLAGEQALYLGLTRDLFSLINLHKGEGCLRYPRHINGALRVLVAFI